jgi:hypothetical protein
MIRTYKEKAPQFQAVEVTDALNQLAEVANMIGAQEAGTSFNTEGKRVAVLKLQHTTGTDTYEVLEGQVILTSGITDYDGKPEVQVLDAIEFHSKYEAI